MRLLVDRIPFYAEDCMFSEQHWNRVEEGWEYLCKFDQRLCVLELNERECNFLKEQKNERSRDNA